MTDLHVGFESNDDCYFLTSEGLYTFIGVSKPKRPTEHTAKTTRFLNRSVMDSLLGQNPVRQRTKCQDVFDQVRISCVKLSSLLVNLI